MASEMTQVSSSSELEAPGLPGQPVGGFPARGPAEDVATISLAAAFKAVGHPVRLKILELLSRQSDPMCVCHIESSFTLSQPTISHHLRLLRRAGLVVSERRGTWIYYSTAKEGVGPLQLFLESIIHDHGENAHGIPN